MSLATEIKRKIFHHLSLIYLLMYAIFPRWATLVLMTWSVLTAGAVEFIRLRRPELNAALLKKFGGIHRTSEIMAPSGIFWTLLGCWVVMVVFVDRILGVTAIGFLVFGDTAAALVGQLYGRTHWKKNPPKTLAGSVAFACVSFVWAALFVRLHGAVAGAVIAAYLESRVLPWNDNLWIPSGGAAAIALCFGAKFVRGNETMYILPRVAVYSGVFFAAMIALKKYGQRVHPQVPAIDVGDSHE